MPCWASALVVASAMQRVSAVSIAGLSLLALVAAVLLVLVLFRTARIPDFESGGAVFFDSTRDTGIWLALAGCGLMLGGALGVDARRADHRRHPQRRPRGHRDAAGAPAVSFARLQRATGRRCSPRSRCCS